MADWSGYTGTMNALMAKVNNTYVNKPDTSDITKAIDSGRKGFKEATKDLLGVFEGIDKQNAQNKLLEQKAQEAELAQQKVDEAIGIANSTIGVDTSLNSDSFNFVNEYYSGLSDVDKQQVQVIKDTQGLSDEQALLAHASGKFNNTLASLSVMSADEIKENYMPLVNELSKASADSVKLNGQEVDPALNQFEAMNTVRIFQNSAIIDEAKQMGEMYKKQQDENIASRNELVANVFGLKDLRNPVDQTIMQNEITSYKTLGVEKYCALKGITDPQQKQEIVRQMASLENLNNAIYEAKIAGNAEEIRALRAELDNAWTLEGRQAILNDNKYKFNKDTRRADYNNEIADQTYRDAQGTPKNLAPTEVAGEEQNSSSSSTTNTTSEKISTTNTTKEGSGNKNVDPALKGSGDTNENPTLTNSELNNITQAAKNEKQGQQEKKGNEFNDFLEKTTQDVYKFHNVSGVNDEGKIEVPLYDDNGFETGETQWIKASNKQIADKQFVNNLIKNVKEEGWNSSYVNNQIDNLERLLQIDSNHSNRKEIEFRLQTLRKIQDKGRELDEKYGIFHTSNGMNMEIGTGTHNGKIVRDQVTITIPNGNGGNDEIKSVHYNNGNEIEEIPLTKNMTPEQAYKLFMSKENQTYQFINNEWLATTSSNKTAYRVAVIQNEDGTYQFKTIEIGKDDNGKSLLDEEIVKGYKGENKQLFNRNKRLMDTIITRAYTNEEGLPEGADVAMAQILVAATNANLDLDVFNHERISDSKKLSQESSEKFYDELIKVVGKENVDSIISFIPVISNLHTGYANQEYKEATKESLSGQTNTKDTFSVLSNMVYMTSDSINNMRYMEFNKGKGKVNLIKAIQTKNGNGVRQ